MHTNDYMPGTVVSHLTLPMTLRGRYCYHLHFAGMGTGAQSILPVLLQLVSDRHRIKAQAIGSWANSLTTLLGCLLGPPNEHHTQQKSPPPTHHVLKCGTQQRSGRPERESHPSEVNFWCQSLAAPRPLLALSPTPNPTDFASNQSRNQAPSFRTDTWTN